MPRSTVVQHGCRTMASEDYSLQGITIMTSVPMRVQALVAAALLMLSACATPFQSKVSRFQQMPAPAGQSFVIQAADSSRSGSLEFAQYAGLVRSEEHTSELQSLMRISYAVFCLKKKKKTMNETNQIN